MADIAAERGTAPFDTLLDIVLADDLRTVLWPNTDDGDETTWTMRAAIWNDPRAMVGGSDAGAHLDRMCGSNYPTAFLGDCLRGRKLVPVEQAVHMMTAQPAALFGLRDRGLVQEGYAADLFVFDPEPRSGSEPARLVHDLPGETPRLYAGSHGVVRVLVNGVETVRDGAPTGAVPGTLLRSGRDTASVVPRPGLSPRAAAPPSSLPPVTPDPNDPAVAVEEPPPGAPARRTPSPRRAGARRPRRRSPRIADGSKLAPRGLIVVVVAVLVAVLLRAFVVQTFYIPSGSMEPTLQIGDRILVNKLSYHLHGVDRGNIVVFSRPPAENCGGPEVNDLVKRVIGLPGETISLSGGHVYVNGKRLDESWLPSSEQGVTRAGPARARPTASPARTTSPPTTTS